LTANIIYHSLTKGVLRKLHFAQAKFQDFVYSCATNQKCDVIMKNARMNFDDYGTFIQTAGNSNVV
jgi:hypothetical protein